MRGLIVITLSLVAVAKCRPDFSVSPPSGSYLPTGQGNVDHSYGYGSSLFNQVEDKKHVYFYSGSEDLYSKFKIYVSPTSKKNTNIIFVKAPGHQIVPEVVAPKLLTEDRTFVYVLVKNPQDGAITIPSSIGTKHTKPEVFFIKYNNKNDAAPQVNAGVQGQAVGSSVPDVGSEGAFVGTLGNDVGQGAGGYQYGGQSNNHGSHGGSGPY